MKALFQDYEARGVEFSQRLARQPWGGLDFHVRDPDGNVISLFNTDRLRGMSATRTHRFSEALVA